MPGLNDSKKLTPAKRDSLRADLLQEPNINFYIAERSNQQIDQMGCYVALKDAYVEVFKALYTEECQIIIDGNLKFDHLGVDHMDKLSVIKADSKYPTVMAASILGKTYRDAEMVKLHQEFPEYDWASNKGYVNAIHTAAIHKYGPCKYHRYSYEPVKSFVKNNSQLSLSIK